MNSAVEELTKSIGNNHWISEWKKSEEVARMKRGEALMIYNVSYTPGIFLTPMIISPHPNIINSSITSKETTRSHEEWQTEQTCSVVKGGLELRSRTVCIPSAFFIMILIWLL